MRDDDDRGGEVPGYLLSKRADDNLQIFNRRVEHDELLRTFMRDVIGVNIRKTENGNIVFEKGNDPLMSLEGAKKIYVILREHINSITSLTQWSEEQVSMILEATCEGIAMYLWTENRNIGLGDDMILPLADGIRMIVHSQLNKSLNGFENKQVSIYQQHEEIRQSMQEKRRSFVDRLTGRNKESPVVTSQ